MSRTRESAEREVQKENEPVEKISRRDSPDETSKASVRRSSKVQASLPVIFLYNFYPASIGAPVCVKNKKSKLKSSKFIESQMI